VSTLLTLAGIDDPEHRPPFGETLLRQINKLKKELEQGSSLSTTGESEMHIPNMLPLAAHSSASDSFSVSPQKAFGVPESFAVGSERPASLQECVPLELRLSTTRAAQSSPISGWTPCSTSPPSIKAALVEAHKNPGELFKYMSGENRVCFAMVPPPGMVIPPEAFEQDVAHDE